MIPFDVVYARPTSVADAIEMFQEAEADGKKARYLSGGTELVTMARDGKLTYDVLIDLKGVPEAAEFSPSAITYGACVRLSDLSDGTVDGSVPDIVGRAAGGVADRTTRNSITLGGNACGMLPYREALLPFLLFNGEATLAGPGGMRRTSLATIFDKRLKLRPGEFLVALHGDPRLKTATTFYSRRTREPRVDYPLVTLCMARVGSEWSLVVGGACGAPVLDREAGTLIAQGNPAKSGVDGVTVSTAERVAERFATCLRTDMRAAADYRRALLLQSVEEGIRTLGGSE